MKSSKTRGSHSTLQHKVEASWANYGACSESIDLVLQFLSLIFVLNDVIKIKREVKIGEWTIEMEKWFWKNIVCPWIYVYKFKQNKQKDSISESDEVYFSVHRIKAVVFDSLTAYMYLHWPQKSCFDLEKRTQKKTQAWWHLLSVTIAVFYLRKSLIIFD